MFFVTLYFAVKVIMGCILLGLMALCGIAYLIRRWFFS